MREAYSLEPLLRLIRTMVRRATSAASNSFRLAFICSRRVTSHGSVPFASPTV
jgi:hypothetical protein